MVFRFRTHSTQEESPGHHNSRSPAEVRWVPLEAAVLLVFSPFLTTRYGQWRRRQFHVCCSISTRVPQLPVDDDHYWSHDSPTSPPPLAPRGALLNELIAIDHGLAVAKDDQTPKTAGYHRLASSCHLTRLRRSICSRDSTQRVLFHSSSSSTISP